MSTAITEIIMEKFNVDYSDKAIGPYHITAFKKDLMGRLQQVIVRMEWKLFWFKEEEKKKQAMRGVQCNSLQAGHQAEAGGANRRMLVILMGSSPPRILRGNQR